MLQAELKEFHSPDVYDLETYQPENPSNFGFLLQAMVGIQGQNGEESFNIMVCTPDWLKSEFPKDATIWGRHYLIVFEYNFERISHFIIEYVKKCTGKDWQEIADRLARIGHWEFEDYQMHRGS